MLLIGGIKKSQLAILFTLFVIVSVVSWFFVFKPYQKDRIMTFINPQSNPQNEGYNVRQSIIAVGSGQLWGRGFALGSQSQLHFLPEPETDFIYAVLAEEFGFVGVLLLIGAYAMILYRLIRLANRTRDNYAAYFCLGLAAMLLVQLFINIGMNMGIAPVTGIPLPFISAGGSSVIALLAALGMANNMAIESK
jgi:rod shape determining protein RodA